MRTAAMLRAFRNNPVSLFRGEGWVFMNSPLVAEKRNGSHQKEPPEKVVVSFPSRLKLVSRLPEAASGLAFTADPVLTSRANTIIRTAAMPGIPPLIPMDISFAR
jgi:hypothetical protein